MAKHKHVGGLNSRNLCDFNLAMLTKQCWSFITNTESLVSRFSKAKYYADSSFLEARLGGSPNFIWRSIYESNKCYFCGFGMED